MPLSSEQIYDELNGEEVKEIILTRIRDLLNKVPDFQRHLTLPRVHMHVRLHLDVYGRRNPSIDFENDLTLTVRDASEEEITIAKAWSADDEVNADTGIPVPETPFDGEGDAPDQIREDHGLVTLEPVKDRGGLIQQRPVDPPAAEPEQTQEVPRRRHAADWKLERGGPVSQGFVDYLPGAAPPPKAPGAAARNASQSKPDVGIQKDFRDAHRPPEKP